MAKQRLFTKAEIETLPQDELWRISWNAPVILMGVIEQDGGLFSAHCCHAEDAEHAAMYRRCYLDVVLAEFVLTDSGYQHVAA